MLDAIVLDVLSYNAPDLSKQSHLTVCYRRLVFIKVKNPRSKTHQSTLLVHRTKSHFPIFEYRLTSWVDQLGDNKLLREN